MSKSKIYDCFSHTNIIEGSAEGKTWYSWGTKGASGRINLGGVVGLTDGDAIEIKRVLGYENWIGYVKLEGKNTENNEGSLIGYVNSTPAMEGCYSESSDTLFGQGSASGAHKVESLTAAGVINNLNGFAANGWVQSSSGGNLYFAREIVLDIRGMKTK